MQPIPSRQIQRPFWAFLIALLLLLLAAPMALAHPLGNFTTNRYSRIALAAQEINLRYIVDMAEIPAYKEITAIDTDGDGQVTRAEEAAYVERQTAHLGEQLQLQIDGTPLTLQQVDALLSFPQGQGGLQTLRLVLDFAAELPSDDAPQSLTYVDGTYPDVLGWQEVVLQADGSVDLLTTSVPAQDRSRELTTYPEDLLQDPPSVNRAQAQFVVLGSGARTETATTSLPAASVTDASVTAAGLVSPGLVERSSDPFADMIALPVDTFTALLLALLGAFVWGGAHALSPGHGKTIVAAYLVGSRGTTRHALFLGLTTTVTHTAGVFLLGFITLFASQYLLPEQLYPWLGVASGLLVVGIGVTMVWGRLGPQLMGRLSTGSNTHSHQDHDHAHQPHHEHEEHTHDHHHSDHQHTHHDHDHHEHGHHHHHDSETGIIHSHGGLTHSHIPPGADGGPITWRSLLALGVSGGLLPCPSALVVMLGAIALQRVGFGLLLIVVFSLGLASVLTLIGVLMVHAGKLIRYIPESGRVLRLAPVGSALFITLAGAVITLQALFQTGILSI